MLLRFPVVIALYLCCIQIGACLCARVLSARTCSADRSHASYSIQQLLCKMLIWKSKCGVYVRVNRRLRGCSMFLWALRHGTAWHLAFPRASHGDFVCSLCPWNTLFVCYCLSYASLPVVKLGPSQGNDGKLNHLHRCQMSFWRFFEARIKNTHILCMHVPADMQTHPKCVCCLVEIRKYMWLHLAKHIYLLCLRMLSFKVLLNPLKLCYSVFQRLQRVQFLN